MPVNKEFYLQLKGELQNKNVTLVAVSKTKPVEDILELYNLGQRDFGENYVQELTGKQAALPKDISWHFIGHLQTNKVKQIAPFIHLIHSVDSYKLLEEINKQAAKQKRIVNCLLQIHIAQEETKFGFDEAELDAAMQQLQIKPFTNVAIKGFMGMASFTNDESIIKKEFKNLHAIFNKYKTTSLTNIHMLSMGMSSDYNIAVEEGSNMIRIGSLLFGKRV